MTAKRRQKQFLDYPFKERKMNSCEYFAEVTLDPERVKADKNKLVFYNVSEFDKMTIQCNSTNKHGYIYENAYLNIQSEFMTSVPLFKLQAVEQFKWRQNIYD